MEEPTNKADQWVNNVTDLADAYKDLLTMRLVEHSSLGIAAAIMGTTSLLISLFIFLFAGFGFAWWLGEYLENMKAGFFIVGGVYSLIFIIILLTSKNIWIPRIRNAIIKKIYEQD